MSFAMVLPWDFMAQLCENTREIIERRVPSPQGFEGAKFSGKVKY